MSYEVQESDTPVFAPDELDALFQQCTTSLASAAPPASSSAYVSFYPKRGRGRPRGSYSGRIPSTQLSSDVKPPDALPVTRTKRVRLRIESDEDEDGEQPPSFSTTFPSPNLSLADGGASGVNTQVPSPHGPDGAPRDPSEFASAVIESLAQFFTRIKAWQLPLVSRNEALRDIVNKHIEALDSISWPQVHTHTHTHTDRFFISCFLFIFRF